MSNKPYPRYDLEELSDFRELVGRSARLFPERVAWCFMRDGQRVDVTFAQFARDVEALGTALRRRAEPGEKIVVIGENSYEWIVAFFAVTNAGLVVAPIDKEYRPDEAFALIERAKPALIVYSDKLDAALTSQFDPKTSVCIQARLRREKSELARSSEPIEGPKVTELPGLIAEGAAAVEAGDESFAKTQVDPDALSAIFFTSGTTGGSKGVMLSQRNFMSDAWACRRLVYIHESTMLVLPLHHTFAILTSVLCSIFEGMSVSINSGLPRLMAELATFKPHSLYVVPLFLETFHRQVMAKIKRSGKESTVKLMMGLTRVLGKVGIDIRRKVFAEIIDGFGGNIDLFITGGAPVDFRVVSDLRAFGIQILNGYGITECSPVAAVNRTGHYRDGSAGLPLECAELKIANPDPDGVGEIWVKGRNVMLGYYDDPEATAKAMDDGWFKTGDLGRFDTDGFLHITGRLKNLIITSNGENVSAEELEELLYRVELIEEVCVFDRGGTITAEVFPAAPARDEMPREELLAALKEAVKKINHGLPAYKRVKDVVIRDVEFEKTSTRKIKR